MKVQLKRPWMADKLYKPRKGGTEIPEYLRDKLPKDAKVLDEEVKKEPAKKTKLDLE